MVTTKVNYQNDSRVIDLPALFRIGLLRSVNRLSVILSLKSLLSVLKMEKSLRVESSCRIRGILGFLLAYYCQSSLFLQ